MILAALPGGYGISDAVIAATIGAVSGWVTALLKLRPERKKLNAEIELIKEQAQRYRVETDQLRERRLLAEREIEEVRKLTLERERLEEDLESSRRQRVENERNEMIELLKVFDREVFDAPMRSEEPVSMFIALRQTRIWLQTSGALYFRDSGIASDFREIRRLLAEVERNVITKFPAIPELLAQEKGDRDDPWRRRELSQERLGRSYYDAVHIMMSSRTDILRRVDAVRARLPSYTPKPPFTA